MAAQLATAGRTTGQSAFTRSLNAARNGQRCMSAARRPAAAGGSGSGGSGDLVLRQGQASDRGLLWRWVLQEKLNPLGLHPERFTVAERGGRVVGVGQLKPLSGGALELASLVVDEGERGRGVGSTIIRRLVEQAGQAPVYLTTISRRSALYQRCGFEEVPPTQVPPFLVFEYVVGIAVAWLAVQDRLVLMRLTANSGGSGGSAGPQR